jgi:DNA-binding transcriptional LysR family regulator
MIQDCAGYGFHPNIIHYTQSLETALLMIEAGLGITLMNSSYKVYASENLRFMELEGEEDSVELVAAWKRDNPNPCIPLLFKVLDKQLKLN